MVAYEIVFRKRSGELMFCDMNMSTNKMILDESCDMMNFENSVPRDKMNGMFIVQAREVVEL